MSDYSWFKLLVRAIGLLLVGLALPQVPVAVAWLIYALTEEGGGFSEWALRILPMFAGPALQIAFGLYLLLGAERLIARFIRDIRGHCACCGYDLASLTADKCPECGAAITPAPPSPPFSH